MSHCITLVRIPDERHDDFPPVQADEEALFSGISMLTDTQISFIMLLKGL
jgi:hypothetical protein